MTATFETIAAAEILQYICGYLDRTSLLYLAAVNKVCNSLANVHLYQEISIDILSGAQLRRDVDRWACLLDRKGSFKHVRRLELNGDMGAKGQVSNEHESRIAELVKQARQQKEIEDQSIWAVEDFPRCRPPDRRPLSQSSQEDRPWEQFAQLLARLTGLKDLLYACANQFPPCLLRVLHKDLPSCRLHLKAFHFFSLHQEETDPYEFALVTSPSLYCLWIRYPSIDSSYRGDHHEAAALRVASGLAPNLKELRLCQYIVSVPRSFMTDRITHIVSPWSGFSQDNFMVLKPSSLIKLELNSEISHQFLSKWSHHADFSSLRMLKLENIYNGKALGWAAGNCNFPSLETLFLGFECNGRQTAKTDQYHIMSESFIRSLPPLKNIRITGYLRGKTLETILQQHGNSVHHLWLESRKICDRFKFDATQVRKILDTCQVLEELTLNPIPRSKGNREETSIYELVGGLCNLRNSLSLWTRPSSTLSIALASSTLTISMQRTIQFQITLPLTSSIKNLQTIILSTIILAKGIYVTLLSIALSIRILHAQFLCTYQIRSHGMDFP